ncbi:MAG: FAD-dependent oxidoreductase [Methanotrichaceae archaeon]|nr:FAD-dependent oxidoreductase [Methanotrichaceae archaeon]
MNERARSLGNKVVKCERSQIDFDIAVIAAGASQNYYGIQGAESTFAINTLEETIKARRFIEDRNPERIMIIGSGLTGVEVASVLAESLDASTYVIEARDRLLPQFSQQTSHLVESALARKGVNVLTSVQVSEVKEDCILFSDGVRLDCDMAIWTAGLKPPDFVENLELPKNQGWILVDNYLRASFDVFAIGR